MSFEQEVFYLLIAGFLVVELALGAQFLLLGAAREPSAWTAFLGQLACQAIAFVLLLRLLFPYRFGAEPAASVNNTSAICFCGLFWAVSLVFSLRGFRALLRQAGRGC